MRDVKRQEIVTDEVCDKCGAKMAIKWGRFGQFLACTNYPECKSTRELAKPAAAASEGDAKPEAAENPYADEVCENCGSPMVLKRGRFGQFLACSAYPTCKTTRRISKTGVVAAAPVMLDEKCPECESPLAVRQGPFGDYTACSRYPECKFIKRETTGVACPRPGCKGEIVVKKSRRGRVFYGCSEYPTCEMVFWDKPILEPCPQCQAPFVLEKYYAKKNLTVKYCHNEECGYRSDAGDVPAEKAKPGRRLTRKAS